MEILMKNTVRPVIKALFMVTQIGISMLVPIFLCLFFGRFLDERFGTGCWFLIFLFLGIAAAFRNIFHLLKPFFAADLEREKQQQAYLSDGAKEQFPASKEEQASGVLLRRSREKFYRESAEERERQNKEEKAVVSPEEEFDAWRRRKDPDRNSR